MQKSIGLVSIDLWGTLVKAESSLFSLMANFLASQSALNPTETAMIIRNLGHIFDERALNSGVDVSSRDKLTRLIRECGIQELDGRHMEEILAEHVANIPLILFEPMCVEVINRIEDRGVRIAYASNSGFIGAQLMRSELRRLGLLDPHGVRWGVFSDELGIAKPNSRFFDFVRRDFLPNEVLHVGDDIIADIQGATAAGIRAVLVDRSGKYSQGARCEVTNSLVTLFDDL